MKKVDSVDQSLVYISQLDVTVTCLCTFSKNTINTSRKVLQSTIYVYQYQRKLCFVLQLVLVVQIT